MLTNAFSDQLEFREYLIKGYYLFQFQRYNGDVVKGDNNELYAAYQRFGSLDSELADAREIANIINDEANKIDAKFIFLSIPRKDAIEKENLPDSYISSDKYYKKISNVKFNFDIEFMKKVYDNAMFISNYLNWDKIVCNNGNDMMKSIDEIHDMVYSKVLKKVR